ncbi:hypothetical protein BaRGS_00015826 [Batillaria attramentaria]|uniref:SH3 domain-containing protein n=1 Tax=Batillaria attramentaria TaxID=370345 RepID=A0ABD0L1C7_9CAEN
MAEDDVAKPKPRKPRKTAKTKAEDIPLQDQTSTKLKVDELLQQVVAQSTKDAVSEAKKKKKKKAKNIDEDAVLESLRKGEGIEGLHKEEDSALLANIYEPDNSPKNEKSNKQRDEKPDDKIPTGETSFTTPVPKTRKKKKKPEDEGTPREDAPAPDDEVPTTSGKTGKKKKKAALDDTQSPREETAVSETETPLSSARAVKKKMKKLVDRLESQEAGGTAEDATTTETETPVASPRRRKKKKTEEERQSPVPEETEAPPADDRDAAKEETATPTKTKKKKKKKGAEQEGAGEIEDKGQEEEPPPEAPDDGEVLAVMIHRTDKLKNDFNILHPVVRVHLVDEATGEYLPKQHNDRAVTSYYELKNEKVDCVLPMMTQPFDFKQKKSTIPMWEELLVFNENFNYFIQTTPKTLALFEIMDFISMNATNNKQESGWHRIAWAFLKVVGSNGKVNVGSKVRLQLFQIPSRYNRKSGLIEPYQWWKSPQRIPYPSTLYVTFKSIVPPDNVEPSTRSMFATQQEQGAMTYADLKRSMNWDSKSQRLETKPLTSWSRLFGQLCRIPNNLILTLPAGKKGCFVIRFSHDGRSLACACGDRDGYPILMYEIPSGNLKLTLRGHFSLVYDLSWSRKDTHLATASADGTVRIWNILEGKPVSERVLPHPGFVYCCKFHPQVDGIVVSGCYDQVLRVWDLSQEEETGQIREDGKILYDTELMQEIEDHHGYINSICFDDDDGQKMYSADSCGTVNIWNVYVTDEPGRRAFVRDWNLYYSLQEPELKDVQINYIEMHPSGRRLLVHCRDNVIRMFDLRVQRVMQQYIGAVNFREKLGSCLTPCGTFIFAASEDGCVYAWNVDTGDQVARYTELNYRTPVTDVAYHPRDHILAVCSLGENHPVMVYKYDPFTAQVDAGLSPRAPDATTDVEQISPGRGSPTMKEEELASARSKVMTKDEFQAHETLRFQRVLKKLDTATMQMSQMPGMVTMDTTQRMDTIGRSGVVSSWSNTDTGSYVATPRSMMPAPSTMSPHAPPTMLSTIQQQQFASQNLYMKQADASWRPTFSEVGRHGSKSPTFFGRPPQMSLSASGGKAQFSFQAPIGSTRKQKKVVALYDYKAQRSDELTIVRGDTILLLHKDSESWWMGEMEDGRQGYFPANYVAMDDEEDDSDVQRSYTAVRTKDGELKFLSGGEDEESDSDKPASSSNLKQTKNGGKKVKKVHYDDSSEA